MSGTPGKRPSDSRRTRRIKWKSYLSQIDDGPPSLFEFGGHSSFKFQNPIDGVVRLRSPQFFAMRKIGGAGRNRTGA
jgi:hypothetical protein